MEKKLKVLLVGSAGRESALAWKIKQSKLLGDLLISTSTTSEIVNYALQNKIDLVIVGPDNYLANGIVDKLQKRNIKVFGPTKKASQIEWSKAFAKSFMKKNGIPSASFKVFKDFKNSLLYIQNQNFPQVIKADGLSFGKGVVIVKNYKEAEKVLRDIFNKKIFGKSGNKVVIEEFLEGKEISVHAFCDGTNFKIFPISKDHKKIYEGDKGPNTGGMGTVAPIVSVSKKEIEEIKKKIIAPTLTALKKANRPFTGILFPGVFLTKDGPKVIEFNARFGDPETQSYMRLLKTDLLEILMSCVNNNLNKQRIIWSKDFACCVVCVSDGYPGDYKVGKLINGINEIKDKDVQIFLAGAKEEDGKCVTTGGRVLGVSTTGKTLDEALSKSYEAIKKINYEGKYFRKDINK